MLPERKNKRISLLVVTFMTIEMEIISTKQRWFDYQNRLSLRFQLPDTNMEPVLYPVTFETDENLLIAHIYFTRERKLFYRSGAIFNTMEK